MKIEGKKISVIGAGRSGISAAKLIRKLGGVPFVSDVNSRDQLKNYLTELEQHKINYEAGKHSDKVFECDLMIVSPGVPDNSDIIKNARAQNIKLISEVELAYHYCEGKIIAITGTNGKTTTTSLCGHVFNNCGIKCHVAGNIGIAFSEIVLNVKKDDAVALEVSSFQLDLIEHFKPDVAVILNITPDHLNRYENSIEKYAASKQRIYKNQDENDYLIINNDDELINKFLLKHKSSLYPFSLEEPVTSGCFLQGDNIVFNQLGEKKFSCSKDELTLRGDHNIANAMAVITAAKIFELNNDKIIDALKSFESVEHRLEFVREIDGVKFINDSKATNVDSVWYALKSFEEPIYLILGGQDKGNDYDKIKDLVAERVKKIYAIGSSADKVFNFFHSIVKVEIKNSFEDVVSAAVNEAREGDVVLLSPACASFDMFENYEQRGKVFKEAVNKI